MENSLWSGLWTDGIRMVQLNVAQPYLCSPPSTAELENDWIRIMLTLSSPATVRTFTEIHQIISKVASGRT
jgi:hypothetical protein